MIYHTLVSTAVLEAHLDDAQWVVFDCRFSLADPKAGMAAYRQSHIPNARYAHLERDLSGPITPHSGRHPLPDFALLAEKLGRWGVCDGTQVVVYDDAGGSFAARMWWLLRCLGHGAVAVLDGGIKQWQKERRALSSAEAVVVAAVFEPQLRQDQWLDVAQLQDSLRRNDIKLLDARAPERYGGEQEPVDAIAGHIPGAENHWWQTNLDADGLFLPAAKLRERFAAILGDTPPERAVHMCGSGVTACHNLVAMEIAGLSGSRLYPGSWSEWIRDPARPVARRRGA
jgi:thiosulfate/3-mercaptopyruvate sulfurtransferase